MKTPDIPVEPISLLRCDSEFIPIVRSGAWTDIGFRSRMEDVYVCVDDFMHHYGLQHTSDGPNAFYGVLILSNLYSFNYQHLSFNTSSGSVGNTSIG